MYWSRQRLKEMAKIALRGSYRNSVFVTLILMLTTGITGGAGYYQVRLSAYMSGAKAGSLMRVTPVAAVYLFLASVAVAAVSVAVQILFFNPMEAGCRGYFDDALYVPSDPRMVLKVYQDDYKNVVKIQFRRMLYICLWGLLFIVPGVIKAYEYRMVPYLLADDPGIDMKTCFARSKAMMDGEKKEAFILDLTFIGWLLLSSFTFGILYLFYVGPYYSFTCAALYGALRRKENYQAGTADHTAAEKSGTDYMGKAPEPVKKDEPEAAAEYVAAAAYVPEQNDEPAPVDVPEPEEVSTVFQEASEASLSPEYVPAQQEAPAAAEEAKEEVPHEPAPWEVYASLNPAPWDTTARAEETVTEPSEEPAAEYAAETEEEAPAEPVPETEEEIPAEPAAETEEEIPAEPVPETEENPWTEPEAVTQAETYAEADGEALPEQEAETPETPETPVNPFEM